MLTPLSISGPNTVQVCEVQAYEGIDSATAVVVDKQDNAIVVGKTHSNDFPTKDAYDDTLNGEYDVFISKFSANGKLLWSTFLGGTDWDTPYGIAADHADDLVLIGHTNSTNFPLKNVYSPSSPEVTGPFVCKFSSTGDLLWSVILRSIFPSNTSFSHVRNVAVDSTDHIILIGIEDLTKLDPNIVVCKLSSNGSVVWKTSFGGANDTYIYAWESAMGLTVDSLDNVVLVGSTWSENFPIQGDAYDSTLNGYADVFVCKLSSSGDLLWSTFLGGSELDFSQGIAVDSADNVVLVGTTFSKDFPQQNTSSHSPSNELIPSVFVCKLSPQGRLLWNVIPGGTEGADNPHIAVDGADNIVFGGYTYSWDFPTTMGTYDPKYNGGSDGFVGKLSSRGIFLWGTFLGGSDDDFLVDPWEDPWTAMGLAVDSFDNIVLVGSTISWDFPTKSAYDSTLDGDGDAVVCKLSSSGGLFWSTFLGGSDVRETFWDVGIIGVVIGGFIGGFIVAWLAILFVILRRKPKKQPQRYSVLKLQASRSL